MKMTATLATEISVFLAAPSQLNVPVMERKPAAIFDIEATFLLTDALKKAKEDVSTLEGMPWDDARVLEDMEAPSKSIQKNLKIMTFWPFRQEVENAAFTFAGKAAQELYGKVAPLWNYLSSNAFGEDDAKKGTVALPLRLLFMPVVLPGLTLQKVLDDQFFQRAMRRGGFAVSERFNKANRKAGKLQSILEEQIADMSPNDAAGWVAVSREKTNPGKGKTLPGEKPPPPEGGAEVVNLFKREK